MKNLAILSFLFFVATLVSCDLGQPRKVKINPVDNIKQVENLLSDLADKPQKFFVSSQQSTKVVGIYGTVIYVDPSKLETVDKTSLGDSIEINLLELTNKESLLLNNAQTVSNGQLLVTGGAYYINMTTDGKQLMMKDGIGIEVELPKLSDSEMDLFLGERDSLGRMNWIKANQKLKEKFNIKKGIRSNSSNSQLSSRKKYSNISDTASQTRINSENDETYEAVELLNFGWINCDRFWNDPAPKIDITIIVQDDTIQEAMVYAVFQDINCIMSQPYSKGEKSTFSNVPQGKILKIFALTMKDKQPYYSEATINTSRQNQVTINFSKATNEIILGRLRLMQQ